VPRERAAQAKSKPGVWGRGERPTQYRYNAALLNRLVFENLRHRPVRTLLSVLAIGVEVTMMLTLVGISYGTLDETARRARGVGNRSAVDGVFHHAPRGKTQ
jgi:hypothetical protein